MRLFGLIGYPLSHSFSRKYFTDKFQREGITDSIYELFPLEQISQLPLLIAEQEKELCGLNVTIPYKEQVLPYLHKVTDEVKEIGAVNCIKLTPMGLIGYNTDVIGFRQSLEPLLQPHHQKALLLGTGGAAKAVGWVLNQLGIEYKYVSRNRSNALKYEAVDEACIREHLVIINTTPLGMQPDIAGKPSLPYQGLGKQHLCYDLVYNPVKTAFLETAERQGAAIKNGYEMLELQAEAAWNIWNSSIE